MKWVTRARPKAAGGPRGVSMVDKAVLDPEAEFLYVPADRVLETARQEAAIPFDVPKVELGHHGPECSFGIEAGRWVVDFFSLCHLILPWVSMR